MSFKYKVTDGDGDTSVVRFDFDFNKGCMIMQPEAKQLIAVQGYAFPKAESMIESFKKFQETGENDSEEFEVGAERRTLLIMINDGWCDSPRKVHEAKNVVEISMKLSFSVSAMRLMAEEMGDDIDDIAFPDVRPENFSFLWDTFCYVQDQGIVLGANPEKKREIEEQVREGTGINNFTLSDAMPKSIGCWALPVKMYPDQDFIVTRVPYEVMEDLYEEWQKRKGVTYDGNSPDCELPIDITEEINALFRKKGKKQD